MLPALFARYIPFLEANKASSGGAGGGGNVSVFPDWRDNAEKQPVGLSVKGVTKSCPRQRTGGSSNRRFAVRFFG